MESSWSAACHHRSNPAFQRPRLLRRQSLSAAPRSRPGPGSLRAAGAASGPAVERRCAGLPAHPPQPAGSRASPEGRMRLGRTRCPQRAGAAPHAAGGAESPPPGTRRRGRGRPGPPPADAARRGSQSPGARVTQTRPERAGAAAGAR